jgi:hypothetical protein
MATEKQMREAIAAVLTLVVDSTTRVMPRDILGAFRAGDYKPLLAPNATRIRGWMVTQAASPLDPANSGDTWAAYRPTWKLWQLHEYYTGSDADNSEDIASAEREAVMAAFADLASVAGIQAGTLATLATISPISFSTITCQPISEGGKLFHWAQAEISARYNTAGC